ncbi:hypothetical protein PMG71_01990 [Roseofilum sp. BLCC_M154]|uniref:Type II toxin-antitoxin system VapC family toxin n=1 Tax=Roseofilum acuticapitatum BLCC-M154 TaxID=3022444 RepID=A0ABT7AMS1_9CYAN|nr:hypothetical protein [Roseofilum acuticapitatum]MDJ1168196.1 hypothetical protein [Roseofilum acuticapitatum BLCC-M154]
MQLSYSYGDRIYLDVCCLHRPFDDRSQQRIQLETEAIEQITFGCLSGDFMLISSTAIESEIYQNPNPNQAEQVMQSLSIAQDKIFVTDSVVSRENMKTFSGSKLPIL